MDRGMVRGAKLVLPDRICHGGMIWQDGILKEIFEEASQVESMNMKVSPAYRGRYLHIHDYHHNNDCI